MDCDNVATVILFFSKSGRKEKTKTTDSLMRKLFRTVRFTLALPSSRSSSARTIKTVSFLFFPLTSTVSPRKSCRVSIVALDRAMMPVTKAYQLNRFFFFLNPAISAKDALLSSLTASVTVKLFGFFFFFRMAVAVSSTFFKKQKVSGSASGAPGGGPTSLGADPDESLGEPLMVSEGREAAAALWRGRRSYVKLTFFLSSRCSDMISQKAVGSAVRDAGVMGNEK